MYPDQYVCCIILKIRFFDKKKWIPDIKKLFGYYQEIILISRIRLIDINKSNFWYQEFDFLIYKTSVIFLVIKNYFLYQKMISWF